MSEVPLYHSVDYEGLVPPNIGGGVSKFAQHKALKLTAWRQVDLR